jgi:hypothetical protein
MSNVSILDSTKKILGLPSDHTEFDLDIITHINSVFTILTGLGVGPAAGYMIEDKVPLWSDYMADDYRLNLVKSLMYLRVRLLFDPPGTTFLLNSQEEQIKEFQWRLEVAMNNPVDVPTTI